MDGKGLALDNIFVEWLWRTRGRPCGQVRACVLQAYEDGWQLEAGLQAYFAFYNDRRFHQSLHYQTPAQVLKGGEKIVSNQVENKINRSGGPVTTSLFNKMVRFQGRSVYAKEHNLTIITKDSDFSERIKLSDPPPRVIHFKVGNSNMKEFYRVIHASWEDACAEPNA